ncbi:MAG: preprotein translocase subunit SecY [Gemmatimonadales bacterium]|nr:preprotein translocase subunit SecY [Gemmatimonadota bacterium]MCL4214414.1 preprotein translocase subunit SecY [Gemmatimonadales bacterium]
MAAVSNIYRTPELWQKITFTFLCLAIYRLGSHVTAPGIDVTAMLDFFANQGGGLLGLYDLFVGGNLSRSTIFALGIMPYISSSIFMQIGAAVVPQLDKMQKDEEGRKKITQYTRYGTVALAAIQAYGYALFTSGVTGAVQNPGTGFVIQMVLFLTTGALFVMWLGEQITERGLGNGASLMIFFSIVERAWPSIFQMFSFVSTGAVSVLSLLGMTGIMLGVVAGVVAMTLAARRIAIQIPQRTMAKGRQREAAKNFIPLRVNSAGVMPIIFAQSLIVVPGAVAQFSGNQSMAAFADLFAPGTMWYFILSAVLIMFFTYFYTSIIFNPVDLAENLKKQGGFIPGIKPGSKTAEYIDQVVTRITLPGAIFLTVIALLPIWLADLFGVPFQFGGTSLLIVVGVALDTMAQMQQHLLLRKYDGFMKKGRVRFRGRGAQSSGY